MAGITLAIAEAKLAYWISVDEAVGGGQSIKHRSSAGDREFTLADADVIRKNIDYWNGWCQRLAPNASGRTGIEAVGVIFE
jgi:hypothetical protein